MRPRRTRWLAPLLAVAGVLALAGVGAWFLLFPRQSPEPARAVPAPPPLPPAASPTAAALPALDASDAFMRQIAASLSEHPEMARWLAQNTLVRTLTAVVAHVAAGETPRLELGFLAPTQRFRASGGAAGRVVADPASYAAYDVFGDTITSIDAAAAVAAYRTTEPLFETAYRELGYGGAFRSALDRAIRELLAVPLAPADAELVAYPGGFRWSDPKLEALSPAQKQLLRMGPRNVRAVQAKLRQVQAALGAPD